MTSLLFGIHDREGRHILPAGGWIVDTVALSENPAPVNYESLRGDINWLVRLNWGYGGTGTIPAPSHYAEFAQACTDYVRNSRGAYAFVIGNEPNHQNERPNGDVIWPQMYADCFNQCYSAMKGAMATRGGVRVMPAPIAPWDATTKYPSNPNGDWVTYFADTLNAIPFCDGLVLHTYTHGAGVPLITSSARMQPPFAHRHFELRAYRDFLEAVPESKRGLPVYITETDQIDPWTDANTGWVQAAYGEVDWWNGQAGTQKIHCLCLYRWPKYDKWHIEGKQGVIDDFRAAIGRGYQSPPVNGTNAVSEQVTTHLPTTPNDAPQAAPALPPRDWDERLTQRGVTVETPQVAPGQQFWRVVKAQWFDEQQAGGRHHIYVEALDKKGNPIDAVPFEVFWPGGRATGRTKTGRGFDAGNFPMSPSLNEFSVGIDTEYQGETVKGIGMGAETPGGFNAGIHTSTLVTFQLATTPPRTQHIPSVIAPGPTPPQEEAVRVPQLTHPIQDPAMRIISQRFGDNPADYAKFGLAGHPGIDFAVPAGTSVRAVDDGQVIERGDDRNGYGKYVKVRHVWGESLYAHLSNISGLVRVGLQVHAEGLVGLSGNTGNSTGPHLHFAMRVFPYQRGAPFDGYTDPMPHLSDGPIDRPADVLTAIKAAAKEFGLEWQLLASQAWAESSFNPEAESRTGAMGLLQIMPDTWDEWGPRVVASAPFFAGDNARVGAAYLAWLLKQTEGNEYHALIAYGWGIGNWLSGKEPPAMWVSYANKIVHGRDLLKAVAT